MSDKTDGTIGVRASVGGREITLDPIRTKALAVEARQVESTIPAGFQAVWASGEVDGEQFELAAGAGFGSEWMTFRYRGLDFVINARSIISPLLEFAEEIKAAEQST